MIIDIDFRFTEFEKESEPEILVEYDWNTEVIPLTPFPYALPTRKGESLLKIQNKKVLNPRVEPWTHFSEASLGEPAWPAGRLGRTFSSAEAEREGGLNKGIGQCGMIIYVIDKHLAF
jgi:hypothetical protein